MLKSEIDCKLWSKKIGIKNVLSSIHLYFDKILNIMNGYYFEDIIYDDDSELQ